MMNIGQYVANLLCEVTMNVLFDGHSEFVADKAESLSRDIKLACRVGSGKSTYHKKSGHNHIIVYGQEMVSSVLSSKKRAMSWTMGKENIKYNFFKGNVTPQILLASVAVHEFAHFIQVLMGGRTAGSVHNKCFYTVLNKLHKSDFAQDVLNFLMEDEKFAALQFGEETGRGGFVLTERECPDVGQRKIDSYDSTTARIGDVISFKLRSGRIETAHVSKVNAKTVSAKTYRVPYGLVTAVNGVNVTKKEKAKFDKTNLRIGMKIIFKDLSGVIVKINQKTVSTERYRVPFSLIEKVFDKAA
jgi:sporulation protein YlmC with PRC-barrel domain